MEWEQSTEHTESDEDEWEQYVLYVNRDVIVVGNLKDVHGRGTIVEIDAYKTEDDKCRTSHEHEGKLHSGIFLLSTTPVTDKEIHRDKGYLIEHEHSEEVDADEESEHTCREEYEPHEELLCEWLEFP